MPTDGTPGHGAHEALQESSGDLVVATSPGFVLVPPRAGRSSAKSQTSAGPNLCPLSAQSQALFLSPWRRLHLPFAQFSVSGV
ncbi:hypothetical protein NDU88_005557 [Pleurodeles waltl]|uniref:Uncharacterized protein n=1 Tax=Pleurodeles waltl TaxID=8319 RepID=A0AAV7LPW2_PLEWA|nr:hypothetical protein NDU88_005557 [Pleurodeles waltl]